MDVYRFILVILISLSGLRCSLNSSIERIQTNSNLLDFEKTEIVISGIGKADGITSLGAAIHLKNSDNTIITEYKPEYRILENPGISFGECTTSDVNGLSYCALTSTVPGKFTLVLSNAKVGLSKNITFKPKAESSRLNLASAGLVNATTNMGSKLTLILGKFSSGTRVPTSSSSTVDFTPHGGQE